METMTKQQNNIHITKIQTNKNIKNELNKNT